MMIKDMMFYELPALVIFAPGKTFVEQSEAYNEFYCLPLLGLTDNLMTIIVMGSVIGTPELYRTRTRIFDIQKIS